MKILLAIALALVTTATLLPATAAGQLMSPEKERLLRESFPPVSDPKLSAAFADPQTLLYTDDEITPAYQVGGKFIVVRDNVGSDGNFRFPWKTPGGMQGTRGVSAFRFIALPKQDNGQPWPIVWSIEKLDAARDQVAAVAWTFPIGTIIGEVLLERGPGQSQYAFEVRTRTRERDAWDAEVYRPFPTAELLAEGIRTLRPDWEQSQQLRAAVAKLEQTPTMQRVQFSDSQNARPILNVADGLFRLPPLDPGLVAELLTEATFEPVEGRLFKLGAGGVSAYAPANASGFNIVPVGYDGTFLGNNRTSCLRCHETAGANQARFDDTWRGHIRGSDGIFSFRPGTINSQNTFVPRGELLDAGLLAKFDAGIHPSEMYSVISSLRHER